MTYVEKEKVLEIAKDKYYSDFHKSMADLTSLRELLEATPAADVVEVRHGKWVYNRGQSFGEPLYFCSLCIDGGSNNGRDNYCPNCGAKMDGKDGE